MKIANVKNDNRYDDPSDYDNFIQILNLGLEGFYDRILLNPVDIISKDIGDEVYNILYMYDRAAISYDKLTEEEWRSFSDSDITFNRFDGNEDYEHYSIYVFIINKLKEFKDMHKTADLNSHINTLDKYREQFKQFEQIKLSGDLLDFNGLKKIFDNYLNF